MTAKFKWLFVLQIFLLLTSVNTCFAIQANLPYVCIIVEGGSSDKLTISYAYKSEQAAALSFKPHKKLWETCYVSTSFFHDDNEIIVTKGAESYKLKFSASELRENDNTMTLNIKNQALTPGKSHIRSVLLISIRMFIILSLQILVFLLFRYRIKIKRNIVSFLVVNFLCWLIINLNMNQLSVYSSDHAMFWINMKLIFTSIIPGIIVVVIMPILINEKGVFRKIVMGLAAHNIGLYATKIMIEYLPF